MPYHILTFDGGGIAGLFTSAVLERLVAEYPPLLPNADLLAGTSTGGIIALCLAAGKTPAELVQLYADHGDEIFDDSFWDNLKDLGTAVGADYDNRTLKKLLTQQLAQRTLGSLSKRVLIPTFDLDHTDADRRTWKPKFFHNFPGSDSDSKELAVDIALRTSAAPTYFPAYQGYIDGGVVANNPSIAAVATALDPRAGNQDLKDIVLLSISAGSDDHFIKGDNLDWGWGQWARPLVSIMISGVMGVAHFQCKQILDERYRRIDRIFDRTVNLDDARPQTIAYLEEQAASVNLSPIVQWLRQRWI
jgi:uncharacterized protein